MARRGARGLTASGRGATILDGWNDADSTRDSLAMQKVVTKLRIHERASDFRYWQSRSYQERLDALEETRREYHRWRYGAEPRFQRVYSIAKRQP